MQILYILLGILITSIFIIARNFIIKRTKNKLKETGFDANKFFSGFLNISDLVLWAKDFVSIFNLRKLIIYGIILSVVSGFFYWKGLQHRPITIDIGYGKEAYIKLDGHFLHIDKTGSVFIEDKQGNKIKQLKVKDIPALKKKLAPYSIEFKPIAVIGSNISNRSFEGGIGVSFLRYWSWRLETFLTNKGIYIGTSYKLDKIHLKNSAIGIGVGKGFKGDDRVLIYFRIEF